MSLIVAAAGQEVLHLAFNVTLRATALLALAGLLATMMRRAPAAARHAVWGAALGGVLLVLATAMLPGWRVLPALGREAAAVQTVPEVPLPSAALPVRSASPERFAPRDMMSQEMAPSDTPVTAAREAGTPSVARTSSSASKELAPATTINWNIVMISVWALGLMAMLMPLAIAVIALRRIKKVARPVTGAQATAALEEVKKALGVTRRVILLESEACEVPMTFGLWRAKIVVPTGAAQWTTPQWRMILTHEMAHIRRHDIAVMWLGHVARAVYWFHPLAWLACARLGIESEKACDDVVINAGTEAPTYATVLVEIAAGLRKRAAVTCAVLHMARQSTLETRVRRVLDEKCRRGAATGWTMMLAMGLLIVAGTVGVLRAANESGASTKLAAPSVKLPASTAATKQAAVHDARLDAVKGEPAYLVLGDVERDGKYPLGNGELTIGDALSKAGLKGSEDKQRVSLNRQTGKSMTAWTKSLTEARDTVLRDEDVVIVNAAVKAGSETADKVILNTTSAADAETEAVLAIAREKADDESAVHTQESVLTAKKVIYDQVKAQTTVGIATVTALAAAEGEYKEAQGLLEIAQHQHQQDILQYKLAQAQAAARRAGVGMSAMPSEVSRNLPESEAEWQAFLAIAKDQANDTTAMDAEKAVLAQKKKDYERYSATPEFVGQAQQAMGQAALDALKLEVVVAEARVKLAEQQHRRDGLKYDQIKAQYEQWRKGGVHAAPADGERVRDAGEEIYLYGAVARPGVYSLEGRTMTMKQALATAGIAAENAADLDIVIRRKITDDTESSTFINLAAIYDGSKADRFLQANDIIIVTAKKPMIDDAAASLQNSRDKLIEMIQMEKAKLADLNTKYGSNYPEVLKQTAALEYWTKALDELNKQLNTLNRQKSGTATKP